MGTVRWLRGHAWLHAESSGLGQGLAVDESERYLAGKRWRDDWAVRVVSAAAPSSARVLWFGCFVVVGVVRWLRGHAWLHAESGGLGQGLAVDEPERYLATTRWRDDRAVRVVSAAAPSSAHVFGLVALQWWALLGGCEGMRGCMLSRLGVGRWMYSTSLSGTLPESVGEMTGLSEL